MKAPHEIRGQDGEIYYRCRGCYTSENLHWFLGTSCPCCSKPECLAFVGTEFQQSRDENYEDAYGRP